MGIFGKLTKPSSDGLTLLDRAAIFATAAEGNTEGAMAYRGSIADRMKRQQQQEFMAQLAGRLGPQYAPTNNEINVGMGGEGNAQTWSPEASLNPVRTSNGLDINSPDLPALALDAQRMGVNLSGLLDVLKAQAPEIDYNPSGEAYNRRTGALTGAVAPKVGEGMVVQRGPGGVLSGIANAPGYVGAASEAAGAIEGAKESAKAGFDLVDVPVGDSTIKLPRAVALPLLSQAFARDNPGAMQGGLPSGFGRTAPASQLAADKIRAEGAATKELEAPAKMAAIGEQLQALDTMSALLPDVVAGFGSDVKLQGLRAAAAFGNEEAQRKVAATETFLNQGRVLVSQIIKSFGANPTEGERKYAEKMSGADAELSPETLRQGITLARERAYRDMRGLNAAGATAPPRMPSRIAIEAELRRRKAIP